MTSLLASQHQAEAERLVQKTHRSLSPPKANEAHRDFLRLEQVNKYFPLQSGESLHVLKDISFSTDKNRICILLGPSGCGKSTLLRLVAGLDQSSSGQILIGDAVIKGPGRDRGMVFQSYTCFPWLSVIKNIEYGLRLNGEVNALAEGTAQHFLDRVKLGDFANAYPDQLSGGMRQRVAIARALSTYPQMLLMDEPFGALDAFTRWQMQELLVEIAERERMTVMMVTHDIDEALFLGDRIVFMSIKPGEVKEVLDPEFKQKGRIKTKEELYDQAGYRDLERHVMHLMRDEEKRS